MRLKYYVGLPRVGKVARYGAKDVRYVVATNGEHRWCIKTRIANVAKSINRQANESGNAIILFRRRHRQRHRTTHLQPHAIK